MTTEFINARWLIPALKRKAKQIDYVFPYVKKVRIKHHYKQIIVPKAVKITWDIPN